MNGRWSGWRLALPSAMLWAFVVVLAETPTLPVSDLTAADLILFVLQTLVPWLSAGLVWAVGVKVAEDRHRWVLLLLLPVATLAAIAAHLAVAAVEPNLATDTGEFLRDVPLADNASYLVWTNLFYGYLYAAGYLVARRGMRGRSLLAARRRERSEADSALREARLASLRGQLQPDLLIEALHALRARFAHDHADGDRLFDMIIAFLRAAMPGVRHHASTLGAEVETVLRYSLLRETLGRTGVGLGAIEPSAASIALPPLLLLPLVDQLARDAPPHRAPKLTTRLTGERCEITIAAAPPETPIAAALDTLDAGVAEAGGEVTVSRGQTRIDILVSLPLAVAAKSRRAHRGPAVAAI